MNPAGRDLIDPDGTFANPEQLRLLTTPIYRYSATAQGILDGALFAFVQGTNPEVLMLIEADATATGAKVWRYGFARMSCFFLRVHQGGQLVWNAVREPVPTTDRGSPYFFRLSAQLDRWPVGHLCTARQGPLIAADPAVMGSIRRSRGSRIG